MVCGSCGLAVSPSLLAELVHLDEVAQWTRDRRAWLLQQADAGVDASVGATSAGGSAAATTTPHRPPATVGGCLLTAGAFALVAAGIVFTAFAWGSLGDVGRFALLVIAGLVAALAGWSLSRRIPAAATTLAVVGSLLIAVASTFLLAQDSTSSAGLRIAIVVIIGVLGIAGSHVQARRQKGAAVLTGVTSAVLVLVAAAAAPDRGAIELGFTALWWTAAVVLLWSIALFALDLIDRSAPWSWLAGAGLVVASLFTVGGVVTDLDAFASDSDYAPALISGLLLVAACIVLLADRLTRGRWWSMVAAAIALLIASTFAAATSAGFPAARPWSALALVAIAAVLAGGVAHVGVRHTFGATAVVGGDQSSHSSPHAHDIVGVATAAASWVVGGLLAFAVALACATWIAPPDLATDCSYNGCTPTPAFAAWIDDSYPWWRGLIIGVAAAALASGLAFAARRRAIPGGKVLPVVAGTVALLLWIVTATADVQAAFIGTADIRTTLATASITTGLLMIGVVAGFALPSGLVWIGGFTAFMGVQTLWPALEIGDWALAPEVHGLLLAAPLLLAGMVHVLLEEPHHVPTMVSVAPALLAVLILPTLAVVDDTATRWFSSAFGGDADPSGVALSRSVILLVVGGLLAVIGARGKWAGVFWPGLAVVVVLVATQLVDAAAQIPTWITLALVGVLLVVAGARWEWVRLRGRRTRQWAGALR
jgi:hypothetical protein